MINNCLEAAKNTGKTFLTGAAVGSVMQGGQNFIRSHVANKDRGGSHATKADNAVANIIEVTGNYNGAANNDFKYDKVVKYNLETVSSELVKMSPEARKNYLDSIGIYKNAFDRETGKLKENSMPYAHREAITANLRTFSGNLSHKPLTGGENITNGAKTAKKTVERVVGSGAAVVVTNELSSEDRAIYNPDDGVIYINNNADLTEKDVAKAVALHEITHTTEGTKAYRKLVKQIEAIANDTNVPESVKKIIGDIALRKFSTANSYEAEMEGLSREQSRYLVDTEVSADLIDDLLSDDYFIEKLAERDMGLLQKLYNSFKNRTIKKNSELGPEGIKYLKKLASKFGTAIEKRANYVQLSQNGDDKEEKEVESASKLRYNKDKSKAKIARYIPYSKIGTANVDAIRRKLQSIYAGTDNTVADGIAIEHGNKIYIVDSGKENGKIDFGVRKAILISNPILRQERQEKINERAISNGFISSELFGQFKRTSNNSGRSGVGRKLGEELSANTGKSQDNQGRVPDENGDRGRGVNSTERKSKIRSYDPKNGKELTFEEVEGGVKINFNDFDTNKSNDNSNDLAPKGSSSRENEAWGYAAADKARREGLDALLKDGEPPRYSPVSTDTDTALLRKVVNNTKAKKYTRADVKAIVTELLSSEGYFGDNTVVMKGKKRAELEKMLWQALNTKGEGELGGAALDAAEYIIQNAIAVEYLEVTDDIQLAVQFVDALKPYLHNMNLDFINGDIKAKLDKDKTPYLMWAVKKDSSFRGYTADEVAQELEALGFRIDKTSEADIFLEINELYRLAKQTITDAVPTKDTLLNALGTKKAKKLKQALAKDILTAQEEKGTETSFYKLQQKYIKQIAELGEKVKTAHRRNTLENRILKEARRIADSNKHTFANATEVQTDALKNIKKLLSRVNSREQVNRSTLRAIMKELAIWYSEKNPVLEGFYDNYIAEHLAYFAETEIEETPSTAERSPSLKDGGKDAAVPTIEISPDSELIKRIENSNKSKYDVIEEYLIEKFYGERFMLSDGKSAIMDKRDANKLSAKANPARTTQLGNLKEIVEKAVYSHSAENIEHNKFSKFEYYSISVKIGEDTFNLWLNVGTAKNDGERHIYALTNKKEEAPTKNGVSRPVGNAIQNASSTDIIPEKTENVKREKPLSMGELEMVQIILHHMNHVFENFGKMWRGGKYVEASDVASAQYDKLKEAEANHSSFEKAILHNKALRYIMDPMAVLAAWDGHDPDGYFTTTYREFAEGLIGQRWDEMRGMS